MTEISRAVGCRIPCQVDLFSLPLRPVEGLIGHRARRMPVVAVAESALEITPAGTVPLVLYR